MRPQTEKRRHGTFSLPSPGEIATDLLILAGCAAVAYAGYLTDPRLGILLAGAFAIGLGITLAPKRE